MVECNDCGVMVVIPTRYGFCLQCYPTYGYRAAGPVSSAVDARSTAFDKSA